MPVHKHKPPSGLSFSRGDNYWIRSQARLRHILHPALSVQLISHSLFALPATHANKTSVAAMLHETLTRSATVFCKHGLSTGDEGSSIKKGCSSLRLLHSLCYVVHA